MYRSASRYESRIQEKPPRSSRSSWGDGRSYSGSIEEDGGRSAAYLVDDTQLLDRDFQGLRGSNDLREAQRLAASFFSAQVLSSTPPDVYRDVRPSRALSPEAPMERYASQSSRHYRERDVGEERWANRSISQERYHSARSLEPDVWEDDKRERMDVYGVPGSRGRKRDDNYGWEEVNPEYGARKDADYPVHADADAMRVTKRVDWTGLFRADGREVAVVDAPLSKRSNSSYEGRQFVEPYRNGQDDLLEVEESAYSGRVRDPQFGHQSLRKGGVYIDDVPDVPEDYGLSGSMASGRAVGRGGLRESDWVRDASRYEDRDSYPRRSGGVNDVGEIPTGFSGGSLSYPSSRVSGHMGRRQMNTKPNYSIRASLTNRDILGFYYGNSSHQPRKEYPRKYNGSGAPHGRFDRGLPRGESGSWNGVGRSSAGSDSVKDDSVLSRKGKKRWAKSPKAGDTPHVSHTSHGKRFKRETEADKLFLMHNSKATTLPSESNRRDMPSRLQFSEKGKEIEEKKAVSMDDAEKTSEMVKVSADNGLWDHSDSWSDSEEEKAGNWESAAKEEGPNWPSPGEERDKSTVQSLQAACDEAKNFLGECSKDDDDFRDWESLASDLDDQLDDVCVQQGVESDGSGSPSSEAVDVGLIPSMSRVEEAGNGKADGKVVLNQDSEMVQLDNEKDEEFDVVTTREVIQLDDLGSAPVAKVVSVIEEDHESGMNREDKAFDYYISLFEQDAELKKLYEANINGGSFECLVCAGVGAKKKKRFPDVGSLVQHAQKICKTKKRPEHRGFAHALCHLLGWDTAACGPSPLSRVSNPTQDSSGPAGQQNDKIVKTALSKPAADMDWELESARRLFEEQLKDVENSSSLESKVANMVVGKSKSLVQEQGKSDDIADVSTDKVSVMDLTTMGDNSRAAKVSVVSSSSCVSGQHNVTVQNSVKDDGGTVEVLTLVPPGLADTAGRLNEVTVIVAPEESVHCPGSGVQSDVVKPVQSPVAVEGDGTHVTSSGFPLAQDVGKEAKKFGVSKNQLNAGVERSSGVARTDGEFLRCALIPSATILGRIEDKSISISTGGNSAPARSGSHTAALESLNVIKPDVGFSVLLAMQDGGRMGGGPPPADAKASDVGS